MTRPELWVCADCGWTDCLCGPIDTSDLDGIELEILSPPEYN